MPLLLGQLNHEEAKINLELQFRNQKKREEKAKEKELCCEIFATCEFLQVANFCNL